MSCVLCFREQTQPGTKVASLFIIMGQTETYLTDCNQDGHLLLALLLRLEDDISLIWCAGELSALILLVCSAAFSVIDHEILI